MPKDLCKIIKNENLSEQEKLEALKGALAEGAEVNETNERGEYPLQLAFDAIKPSPVIIKFLLEQGANFTVEHLHKQQPIHKAIVEGWLDILKILFERKLYLFGWYTEEAHSHLDTDMYHYQETAACLEMIKCELTPLSIATQTGRAEIVEFILNYEPVIQQEFNKLGLKITPLLKQSYTRFLPESGESDAPINTYKVYPIHLLAFDLPNGRYRRLKINGWSETLKVLLKHGCDINQPIPDKDQDSLLHLLSKSPEAWHTFDEIKFAIKQGANPYQKNRQGQTLLITYYGDFNKLTQFLYEQGYDLNQVWQPKNALPRYFNFETVLNYFPQYYVNVCHNAKISETNLGGIINRTITEKTFEMCTEIKSYRLAFNTSFKDNYSTKKLKKWAITQLGQLKALEISQEEWAQHLKVLAAYLMSEPKYVDANLRKLLGQVFMVVIETMLAKGKFETKHLPTLKMILENSTYVPKEIISITTDYYLKLYQKFFTQLPSLKILALDTLLTHAHDLAEDTEIVSSEMCMIKNIFESAPVKTIKTENGFHHLSFFCAESSSSSEKEDSNDSLRNSHDNSSACTGSKRSISEVEDEETEQPSPKRHKI